MDKRAREPIKPEEKSFRETLASEPGSPQSTLILKSMNLQNNNYHDSTSSQKGGCDE